MSPPVEREAAARPPRLSVVVVHWHAESELGHLLERIETRECRPDASEVEWIVVDNGSEAAALSRLRARSPAVRWLAPGRNLGFGPGCNLGWRDARGDWILFLNPDARPLPGAVETLLAAVAEAGPEVAGLVPRLVDSDENEAPLRARTEQVGWQLRPVPRLRHLLAQTLFLDRPRGPSEPPPSGTRIGQPAAAALALRRTVLERLDGFDERFVPAWFEDVDLASRLADGPQPRRLLYRPEVVFEHARGSSVPALGFGAFLSAYYRNHLLYLRLHHGRIAELVARGLLALASLLRLTLLPLRVPSAARDRREAASALIELSGAALFGLEAPTALDTEARGAAR